MCCSSVDTNLVHARADDRHGLPISGHEALLRPAKLVAGGPTGVLWKGAQVLERRPEPAHGLLDHDEVYTYLYGATSCLTPE